MAPRVLTALEDISVYVPRDSWENTATKVLNIFCQFFNFSQFLLFLLVSVPNFSAKTNFLTNYTFTDVNECATVKPCKNGATCVNTLGGYQCRCPNGFQGKHCDQGRVEIFPSTFTRFNSSFIISLYPIFFQFYMHVYVLMSLQDFLGVYVTK